MNGKVSIGTRGSALALWQSNWVKSALEKQFSHLSFALKVIKTKGDRILDVPLAKVGGKGLFVKEIEDALLDGRIDLAVHSMKDMPAEIPPGLAIGAIPRRENPQDVLLSKNGLSLSNLAAGARIGTGSLRRAAQLRYARKDLDVVPLRGNLDTRIRKLTTEDLDGIILAAAGVRRLGFESKITQYLDENIMLPAAGQGALCIEVRQNDPRITPVVGVLNHLETQAAVLGERAFLNRIGGSCQVPVAAYGKIQKEILVLCALVADIDGKTIIKETASGSTLHSVDIGTKLADRLLARGAKELLEKIGLTEHETTKR
ncbi:MAG: hydroxymethylbilane synthase [Desulfobacterales bacterium]|nr:hydroxymethylbilane synthase [Desulfobacterales bacterium]